MPMRDMFAELNNAPDVSSQQSFVNRGQPMGADAMYQQMGRMPRGNNFAEQGGYEGKVYNTPPAGSGFGNMNQTMQMTPQMRMQLMQALKAKTGSGQISQGDMQNAQQANPMARPLSSDEIRALRVRQHREYLNQVFNQERMKGMLE